MKKNLLVAAIAVFSTQGAFATAASDAGDISDPAHQPVTFASETFVADSDGYDSVTIPSSQEINMPLSVGLGPNEEIFVRIELANAVFHTPPNILKGPVYTGSVTEDLQIVKKLGGAAGDDYIIYSIKSKPATGTFTNTYDPADTVLTLDDTDTYNVTEADTQISYKVFSVLSDAIDDAGDELSSLSAPFTSFSSGDTGTFSTAGNAVATISSGFKYFDDGSQIASLGSINGTLLLVTDPATYAADDSIAIEVADIGVATSQTVKIDGDFSFGGWELNSQANCLGSGTALTIAEDDASAATATAVAITSAYYLCVNNSSDSDKMLPGSYDATLVEADLTATIGEIKYNTMPINIDYLTTTPGYTQRIFLINKTNQPVNFTTTFETESTTQATALPASSGQLDANEYRVINADDFVEFTGDKLRGSATIQVEGVIEATTQTYNQKYGSTDTVKLTPID